MLNCAYIEVRLEKCELLTRVKGIGKTDNSSTASRGPHILLLSCRCAIVAHMFSCVLSSFMTVSPFFRGVIVAAGDRHAKRPTEVDQLCGKEGDHGREEDC